MVAALLTGCGTKTTDSSTKEQATGDDGVLIGPVDDADGDGWAPKKTATTTM